MPGTSAARSSSCHDGSAHGWKRSGFGDLNQHGPDSIRFYTKTETVTQRWPSGLKESTDHFVIPTMD
ncbi:hypothetical protein CRI78_17365 [Mycolicibacterium diernhoferi]|uniref:Methylmalonate-semialdehyde dehydrogenase n=1 Tax=Mycolicibacterium diernhoferi TaxID=1801 RepID=A0A1T3WHF5_9MYCO|nr:hypothetical protein BV510_13390 [Mycolicibacterium diernhoferi]PEG53157.1 hypothetical protein CRI78_17365 [Mycolicibacterium diernhoferi]